MCTHQLKEKLKLFLFEHIGSFKLLYVSISPGVLWPKCNLYLTVWLILVQFSSNCGFQKEYGTFPCVPFGKADSA